METINTTLYLKTRLTNLEEQNKTLKNLNIQAQKQINRLRQFIKNLDC